MPSPLHHPFLVPGRIGGALSQATQSKTWKQGLDKGTMGNLVHHTHPFFELLFFNRSRDRWNPGSMGSAFEAYRIGVPSLGGPRIPSHLCTGG